MSWPPAEWRDVLKASGMTLLPCLLLKKVLIHILFCSAKLDIFEIDLM